MQRLVVSGLYDRVREQFHWFRIRPFNVNDLYFRYHDRIPPFGISGIL
jgi:hypothetical protein